MAEKAGQMIGFLKTTIIGGLLFTIPFAVLVIVFEKVVPIAKKIVAPIAERIPAEFLFGLDVPILLALAVIVLACFLIGLIARTRPAKQLVKVLETALLGKIPGYSFLKNMTADIADADGQSPDRVVLVRMDDAWQLGIKIEDLDGGQMTAVFIPDSPTPETGAVMIFAADRVKPANIPIIAAYSCLRGRGDGIGRVLVSGEKAVTG